MHILTPETAAAIADGVYLLQNDDLATLKQFGRTLGCEGRFTVPANGRFEGRSGALLWKPLSGFGYVAMGEGAHAGEMLLATRGTAMLADWVTDAAIAVQRGPGGLPVHAGFNETWKSFAPALREFLRGRNPSRVHCIGHSLGGALAMLNADFLTSNGVADVALYTFGAPRTGDGVFAHSLTARVGAEKVFRVSNPVDPVAMIPLFPFWHLPFGGRGHVIQRTADLPISFAGHSMVKSYVPGVAGKDWGALHDPGTSALDVSAWLRHSAQGHGSFLIGSARLLAMIADALGWLMKTAGKVVLGSINLQLSVGLTVLDQVAWLLSRAAHLSAQIGLHVKALISAISRFLGRKTLEVGDVTVSFLRWLLGLLFNSLRAAAQRALTTLGR